EVPRIFQMLRDRSHHVVAIGIRAEKVADLIRHPDQMLDIHRGPSYLAGACAGISAGASRRSGTWPAGSGNTCTAVTLYSGQLVAQSEFSVVTTLVPLSGKWKVVYTTPGATRSVITARKVMEPARLATVTHAPSLMPRCSASCGWISRRSS